MLTSPAGIKTTADYDASTQVGPWCTCEGGTCPFLPGLLRHATPPAAHPL